MLSYSVGGIVLNILSLYLTDADTLMNFVAFLITLVVIPVFIYLQESPRYLYEKGQVTSLVTTLNSIGDLNQAGLSRHHFEKRLGIGNINLNSAKYKNLTLNKNIEAEEKVEDHKSFYWMFTDSKTRFTLIALCI